MGCVKACVALKRKNPTINGVTYGKRGCYCEYKQKRRNGNKSWKNCFLKLKPVKPVRPVKPGKKYTCAFKIGDGTGGPEKKIGHQKGAACVKACVALKRKSPTINGVTYVKRGCYCEYKQKRRNHNKSWRNCFLKRKPGKPGAIGKLILKIFPGKQVPLVRRRLMKTIALLPKQFDISFDFKPTKWIGGWTNILHLTTGANCCGLGQRIPAI